MLVVLKNMGVVKGDTAVFISDYTVAHWVDFKDNCWELVLELLRLTPNKNKYYQRGRRAMRLILSAS